MRLAIGTRTWGRSPRRRGGRSLALRPDQPVITSRLEGLRRKLATGSPSPGPSAPADGRAHIEAASLASAKGEHAAAVRALRLACALEPENPDCARRLGIELWLAQDERAAHAQFQAMLAHPRRDRAWASGLVWYAGVKERAGDLETAQQAYQQIFSAYPNVIEAQEGLLRTAIRPDAARTDSSGKPRKKLDAGRIFQGLRTLLGK